MRSIWLLLTAAVLICSTAGWSQYRSQLQGGDTEDYLRSRPGLDVTTFRGLLDPSRMKMSHSVSMGYYNGGGVSASRGLYMNRIDYQISRPLSVTTHLGYQFQPSGPAEWNPANTGNEFVGGADLNWCPSRNTRLRLSVYKGLLPEYGYHDYLWGSSSYRPYGFWPY